MPIQYIHCLIILTIVVSFFTVGFFSSKKIWLYLQLLLVLNLLLELAANMLWYKYKMSNLPAYNIVVGYNFVLWFLILKEIISNTVNKYINYSLLGFIIFYGVNILLIQKINVFNSYSFLIGTIICAVFVLWHFTNMFKENEQSNKTSTPHFILLCCCLLYHSGFSVLLFINNWGATKLNLFNDFTLYQLISYTINTVFYGLLILAMFMKKKKVMNDN